MSPIERMEFDPLAEEYREAREAFAGVLLPRKRPFISVMGLLGFGKWPASTSHKPYASWTSTMQANTSACLPRPFAEPIPRAGSRKPQSGGPCSWRIALKSSPRPARIFPIFPARAMPLKNRSRMTYATFGSQGLFIGSGVVEAGLQNRRRKAAQKLRHVLVRQGGAERPGPPNFPAQQPI